VGKRNLRCRERCPPVGGGRKGEGCDRPRKQIQAGHDPLVGLLLDTDEVVMREPVGIRMVVGFHSRPAVPDHHIQDGYGAAQRRKADQEEGR
jgi:hypothetical protein